MQSSGESNLPSYSRSSTPLKEEDPYKKQMMEMNERPEKMEGKHLAQIERMEDKHLAQMKEIHNKFINMERAQSQHAPRTFPPTVNWQRKAPNHD